MMASRMFFLMSSIFCRFSVSLKPLTCRIRICLTMVDLPDSPAPSSSSRCVARYTCLSFCSCRVMASLRLFCDLESSEVCPLEPCEPKQPMAHARGPHQQPPPPSAPTAPPAPPCPVACPVATAAVSGVRSRPVCGLVDCASFCRAETPLALVTRSGHSAGCARALPAPVHALFIPIDSPNVSSGRAPPLSHMRYARSCIPVSITLSLIYAARESTRLA